MIEGGAVVRVVGDPDGCGAGAVGVADPEGAAGVVGELEVAVGVVVAAPGGALRGAGEGAGARGGAGGAQIGSREPRASSRN